jgi:alpha-tubulin suppressor-like RCC1 family protein
MSRKLGYKIMTLIDGELMSAIASGNAHGYALKTDGSAWSVGNNSSGQLGLGDTTNRSAWTELTDPFDTP